MEALLHSDQDCRTEDAEPYAQAMMRILVECFNNKVDDAERCRLLGLYVAQEAIYLHVNEEDAKIRSVFHALEHIIQEYGEVIDMTYMGRDEEGEKQYSILNPDTNWTDRCHNVLWPILKAAGIR